MLAGCAGTLTFGLGLLWWGVSGVRGGVKIYRGSAAGARAYLDAERGRADDYYLGEGNGQAERLSATREGSVESLGFLEGDAYEAWVAGIDPHTGELRGRIRSDSNAVRFAEFVINGPKSWSLAAELHPDIAAAYEKAQDAAASEVVAWFAQHGVTRVGPRGGQVAVPVERIEAAMIRHYTSRAGDPHRHLHLQINARVEAAGKWRGLDTVAVRNSIAAVQGIGHAAIAADPGFRTAIAEHGYTLDPVTGELEQIAPYVGVFSKRAEQITRHIDGYERQWRTENPGHEPGPGLRRSWDARAWADARPDKQKDAVLPGPVDARGAWIEELSGLGFTPPEGPVPIAVVPVGQLDRDQTAARVVARLTAARSAWNAADLRGAAELLIVEAGIVASTPVRSELAEDITARAVDRCVPILERSGLPEHVRSWTSPAAVETEADLGERFAARGSIKSRQADLESVGEAARQVGVQLDAGQEDAAAAMAGAHPLVVVTGAAGAGKTTTLAVTREMITAQGHSMLVVTPTLKAARSAQRETGAEAGSAAWLAYQHGYRWNSDGVWSRLQLGDLDPVTGAEYRGPGKSAQLTAGDLLVVDEAGMLDQDTARALLHIADQGKVRIALVGDPHQLPAVGRGGVLDLAHRYTSCASSLEVIHRFTTTAEIAPGVEGTVTDTEYAALSLTMRTGEDPGAVFDTLHTRGQVAVYADEAARTEALATEAATAWASGERYSLSADTRESVRQLSAAVRERLVSAGHVDDTTVSVTSAGERIGAGDRICTRRNDHQAGVANRDLWRVETVGDDGSLTITGDAGTRTLDADYARAHVELAYASTVYGVQGDTVASGHLVLGESTTAQAAYVGMTRGRTANTVHIVADDTTAARAQWMDTATRDRADLGLRTAREQAERAAGQYASSEQIAEQRTRLAERLHTAWTAQGRLQGIVDNTTRAVAQARRHAEWLQQGDDRLATSRQAFEQAQQRADDLAPAAQQAQHQLEQRRGELHTRLVAEWNRDQLDFRAASDLIRYRQEPRGVIARMSGKTARHEVERQHAEETIRTWRAKWGSDAPWRTPYPERSLLGHAEQLARQQLPDSAARIDDAAHAHQQAREARQAYEQEKELRTLRTVADTATSRNLYRAQHLPGYEAKLKKAHTDLQAANEQVGKLTSHPLASENWISQQRQRWAAERARVLAGQRQAERAERREAAKTANRDDDYGSTYRGHLYENNRDRGYGIGD